MELQKISALKKVNDEIIARIVGAKKNSGFIRDYTYKVSFVSPQKKARASTAPPFSFGFSPASTAPTYSIFGVPAPPPASTAVTLFGAPATAPASTAPTFSFGTPATDPDPSPFSFGVAPAALQAGPSASVARPSPPTEPPKVIFKAEPVLSNAADVIKQFVCRHHLTPIEDLFNDKLDYQCKTFSDIQRLNDQMHTVAQKYRMFGGSAESLDVLKQFLQNFEVLQVMLGELESILIPARNRVDELSKVAEEANAMFEKAFKEVAVFQPDQSNTV